MHLLTWSVENLFELVLTCKLSKMARARMDVPILAWYPKHLLLVGRWQLGEGICKDTSEEASRRGHSRWDIWSEAFEGRSLGELWQVFGILGLLGITWEHLRWFGSSWIIWNHLGSFEIIWNHLSSSGIGWDHLESSASIWPHLDSTGVIWDHLGSSGFMCLVASGMILGSSELSEIL